MKRNVGAWIIQNRMVVANIASLLMMGVACSAIYWPAGLLVVGGLLWIDLFVTDLIDQLKTEGRREDDGRSR